MECPASGFAGTEVHVITRLDHGGGVVSHPAINVTTSTTNATKHLSVGVRSKRAIIARRTFNLHIITPINCAERMGFLAVAGRRIPRARAFKTRSGADRSG